MTMKLRALALAEAGFAVFPLAAREKLPVIPKRDGGRGCLDATRDPKQIETWWYRWPNANIGLATGLSEMLVVDLDGDEGIIAWNELEIEHGTTRTLAASTGTGGMHLYYRSKVGKNTARKLGPGIDTRGDGGYVVAPPSIHPNGNAYSWLNADRVAIAPDWLLDLLARREPELSRLTLVSESVSELGNAYADRAWPEIVARIETAAEGTRNDQLNAGAYSAGRLVASNLLSRSDAEHGLLRAALVCGLGQYEAEITIASGLNAGTQIPVELKLAPAIKAASSIPPPRFKTPRFYPPKTA